MNNNKYNEIYPANSIFIVNNLLFVEDNRKNSKDRILNKKRKNPRYKIIKDEINNKDENTNKINENKLFDESGQMIFKHNELNQFKKFQNISL